VEINASCDAARAGGHRRLAPTRQQALRARYDALVADPLAANPEPSNGHKRNSVERASYNLAVAFDTHRKAILRYMYDLDVGFTNYAEVRVMPRSVPAPGRGVVAGRLSSA